jgi:formylmethanofuran dehydrogenase subunit B
MNLRQKNLIKSLVLVVLVTVAMVIGLVNFKDWVNRNEAMRAMQHLGQIVLAYRQEEGSVPPGYYVDSIQEQLVGSERLGQLKYRARWIEYGAGSDEILAYTRKNYRHLLFGSGAVVLRLDGRVEWMKKKEFDALLASQQSRFEIETGH